MSSVPSPNTLFVGEAALYYAALGWPVFPLLPNDKRPLTAHGYQDATTHEPQIKRWWYAHPDANLGLDCGGAGLVVIDVDAKHGGREAWARLNSVWAERFGPGVATLSSTTGGGGLHIFYRAPAGSRIANSADRLAPGIDVRATGGYVVLPPSRHPSGKQYRWCDWRDIAELPEALYERLKDEGDEDARRRGNEWAQSDAAPTSTRLRASSCTPYAAAALAAETQSVRAASNGTRNDSLYRAAFNLGQLVGSGQLPQAHVESALSRAAHQSGLPDGEIRKTLASGLNAGMDKPRTRTTDGRREIGDRRLETGDGRPKAADDAIPNLQSPISNPPSGEQCPSSAVPRPPSIIYLVEDGRLVSKVLTTNGLVTRELCNFQATLSATLIIDDGERKRRIYTLSGRNTRGRSLPEARIDAAEFDAMRWVSDHWGAHAIISAGHSARDHLSRAILHLSQDTLRERQVYTYTGWRSEGEARTFLCSADAGVTLELDRELERYRLPRRRAAPRPARPCAPRSRFSNSPRRTSPSRSGPACTSPRRASS